MNDHDDDVLDPAAMLALAESADRGVRRNTESQVPLYYFVWGAQWLVGMLLLWAAWEGSSSPVAIPMWFAAPAFAVSIIVCGAISAIVGARSVRGISGTSQVVGLVYGFSWTILGVPAAMLGVALVRLTGDSLVGALYFPSVYALIVAAMYLAGFMLWRSVDQFVIAIVLAVTASLAPFVPAPDNLLAVALLAGPALLAGGVVAVIRNRRLR